MIVGEHEDIIPLLLLLLFLDNNEIVIKISIISIFCLKYIKSFEILKIRKVL
jgi:hypothetical protein